MMNKLAKPARKRAKIHRSMFLGSVSALGLLAVSTVTAGAKVINVGTGDTVWGIAQREGLSTTKIEEANPSINHVTNSIDLIFAGQQLQLPTIGNESNQLLSQNGIYTVQKGDTLSRIAKHFDVTVAQLKTWNHLNNDLIYVGQQLAVKEEATSQLLSVAGEASSAAPTVSAPSTVVSQTTAQPRPNNEEVATSISSANSAAATNSVATNNVAGSQTVVPGESVAATANNTAAPLVSAGNNETGTQQADVATNYSGAGSDVVSGSAQTATTAGQMVDQPSQSAQLTQPAAASEYVEPASQASPSTIAPATNNSTGVSLASSQVVSTTSAANSQSWSNQPALSNATSESTVSSNQQSVASTPAASSATTVSASQTNNQAAQSSQVQTSTSTATANGNDLETGSVVSLAVKLANSNIPYVWGGNSLSGMDCSGLVDYVYAHATGKQLPHYTVALENCVNQHPVSQAQSGDLLFWGQHGATYHTAIYIGNNQYVAAPQPGQNVQIQSISQYFAPSFAGTVK